MAPLDSTSRRDGLLINQRENTYIPLRESLTEDGLILEAWGEGWNVGALIILLLIVICNYRNRIILHKLILLELTLALPHGTFIFGADPVYGWYLSATAALLFISYQVHNVVSWLKIRPFLPRWGSRVFIISLLAVQPFWVAEAWSNFEYFNYGNAANTRMRPFEFLVRDPWWIYTTWKLLATIGRTYGFSLRELVRINTRFGIMLACMFLSIVFVLADVVVTFRNLMESGINPYWRMALVFKCAADCIFLDDFKTVLDQISQQSLSRVAHRAGRDHSDSHGRTHHHYNNNHNNTAATGIYPPESVTATVEVTQPQPASRWNWTRRLSSSSNRRGDAITVQREMTIMTEPKRPRSFSSDVPLVQKPPKARAPVDDEGLLSQAAPQSASLQVPET